ncbi:MAG TPA: dTDP-4-dehydrorhamnose reductase [Thermoanaerobaculia bacterium]|nr:dTDP-4-dehydrorhamnose reductase [Thermoanaerobaculia bacterium]
MKWLITGASGMVGSDLRDALDLRGEDIVALAKSDLDITDSRDVQAAVAEAVPDVIVNCAAYTRVDDAESNESLANAVNGSAVELLARSANDFHAILVQLSTDFVFDGSKRAPYEINERTAPLSAYGRSKLLGENAAKHAKRHVVLRTSWLFGKRGNNFVEAIRRQLGKGVNPLRVVNDQRGRPTYTPHLAEAIIRVVNGGANGVVQYADEPECTWYDFACAIVEELGAAVSVNPVSTEEFPRPAKRPAYSVLSTERYERITGVRPESWREGLHEYLHA